MKKYLKIWLKWAWISLTIVLGTYKLSAVFFLLGKVVRFLFVLLAILIFVGKAKALAGYTLDQAILFFLVFNLVDVSSQFLFRGLYWFRGRLISGQFDYVLLRPLSPLFDVLFSHPDPLDLISLFFLIFFLVFFIVKNNLIVNLSLLILFLFLLLNAFVLAFSFHVLTASFGVITLEVDHLIWIYRDLTQMSRIPVDIYAPLIKGFLTFVIPVGIMITFPAKVLMGLLSWQGVVLAFFVSGLFLFGSLKFWDYALTQYSSASS